MLLNFGFFACRYSVIRHTQKLQQIKSYQVNFHWENTAPYKQKNTVIILHECYSYCSLVALPFLKGKAKCKESLYNFMIIVIEGEDRAGKNGLLKV